MCKLRRQHNSRRRKWSGESVRGEEYENGTGWSHRPSTSARMRKKNTKKQKNKKKNEGSILDTKCCLVWRIFHSRFTDDGCWWWPPVSTIRHTQTNFKEIWVFFLFKEISFGFHHSFFISPLHRLRCGTMRFLDSRYSPLFIYYYLFFFIYARLGNPNQKVHLKKWQIPQERENRERLVLFFWGRAGCQPGALTAHGSDWLILAI